MNDHIKAQRVLQNVQINERSVHSVLLFHIKLAPITRKFGSQIIEIICAHANVSQHGSSIPRAPPNNAPFQ